MVNCWRSWGSGSHYHNQCFDKAKAEWEIPIMNATVIDSRRRLVMPPELPPRSPVTVQQIDEDTWIVKRARPRKVRMAMLLPDVKIPPHDPEWPEIESRIVAYNSQNVAAFEE
jgi:hypothetical protein